jgi:Lrp/AsnC family transcriptional regulator, regulator for asnA, asnC and gidA
MKGLYMVTPEVDEVDRRLIRCLLDSPRASYAELARTTGVGETTARRRVEALISSGVITPSVIPDVRRLGFQAMAIVGVNVDLNHLYEVAETIREFPEITSLHLTMGRYDLMMTVASSSLDNLTRFLVEKVAPLPGIRDTESFVSSRALKILRHWRLPAEEELTAHSDDGVHDALE